MPRAYAVLGCKNFIPDLRCRHTTDNCAVVSVDYVDCIGIPALILGIEEFRITAE